MSARHAYAMMKLLVFASSAFVFVLIQATIELLSPLWSSSVFLRVRLTHLFCRFYLRLFGIKKTETGPTPRSQAGGLIVANHLSFLDILVLGAQTPCVFVTSIEIKKTLGLGWLARAAGCRYVERRSRKNLPHERTEIVETLRSGIPVVLFAEGTSSNGDEVLPFKQSLFQSAIDAQTWVAPVCINYTRINHQAVSALNRDQIFYYGDQKFLTQLFKIALLSEIHCEVLNLTPMGENSAVLNTRQTLADVTHRAIRANFRSLREEFSNRVGARDRIAVTQIHEFAGKNPLESQVTEQV